MNTLVKFLTPTVVVNAWNRFFFQPISPASIGLFRIFFGLVVFVSILGKYPYRDIFYGAEAIVSYDTVTPYFPGNPLLHFRWMPDSDPELKFFFIVLMVATASLIIGYRTRVSSIIVFIGLMVLNNRNPFIDNNGDNLMRINAFWLMFTQADAAYSVDKWIRVRRRLESRSLVPTAPWGQRLLQLQLAYLYFEAAVTKTGSSWWDGTALYYALNYVELRRFDFQFLVKHLWQIKLLTYGTMVAEFAAFSLIWFRKFRYPVLFAAAMLHIGINLLMQFPVFQYVMLASLVTFVYPEDIERLFDKFKRLKL